MRKIKFRALIDDEELCNEEEILYHLDENENFIPFMQDLDSWYFDDGQTLGDYFDCFDKEKIMQYTGLKDKTGKEIYEGDIVKAYNGINEIIGIVKFGKYKQDGSGGEYNSITCTGFYVERIKTIPNAWEIEDDLLYEPDYEKTTSLQSYEYIKVIGNIHDNPELLEV